MKNKIVAIQGNNLKTINPKSDTSIFLAHEIQNRYKIFYYEPKNLSIVNSKVEFVEHITRSSKSTKKNMVIENYNNEDKNTRLLTQKILLEKFNEKYKGLGENQKTLLQEYVNAVSNSPALKT